MDIFKHQHPSIRNNALNLRWRLGVLKFIILKPLFLLRAHFLGPRCQFGQRISLQGSLRLRGPGQIIISDDVIISDHVDLYTHTKRALIEIGPCSFLNGCRMSVSEKIEIGELNIIADVRLMDTDFHWSHQDRNFDYTPPPTKPIKLLKNVWVSAGSAILKGVTIGENSVVAFGSVVTSDVPPNEIWGGSPAKKIRDIPLKNKI